MRKSLLLFIVVMQLLQLEAQSQIEKDLQNNPDKKSGGYIKIDSINTLSALGMRLECH